MRVQETSFCAGAYWRGTLSCKFQGAAEDALRSWLHRKDGRPEASCSRFLDISCSHNTSSGFFHGPCSSVKTSQIISLSRRVPILLFVVTIPLHRCSVANVAWDPLASVGRMLTIFGVLARGADCTNFHLARLIAVVQIPASMFTTQPPAKVQMCLAMKCLRPTRIVVGRAIGYHVFAQSHGRSLRAVALAVGHWSSSMVTSLSWRSAIVKHSFSPSLRSRPFSFLERREMK